MSSSSLSGPTKRKADGETPFAKSKLQRQERKVDLFADFGVQDVKDFAQQQAERKERIEKYEVEHDSRAHISAVLAEMKQKVQKEFGKKRMAYKVEIRIDSREKAKFAKRFLEQAHFPFTVTRAELPAGDIWVLVDGRLFLVYERKTIADMLSSVKSRRNHDQTSRIVRLPVLHTSQIVYILEQDKTPDSIEVQKTRNGFVKNKKHRDLVRVEETLSMDDTELFLLKELLAMNEFMSSKLATLHSTLPNVETFMKEEKTSYEERVKQIQKDNVKEEEEEEEEEEQDWDTIDAAFNVQLPPAPVKQQAVLKKHNEDPIQCSLAMMQPLRRMTEEKAKAIRQAYPSLVSLSDFTKEGEATFVKTIGKVVWKGNKNKIGPKLAQGLFHALCAKYK